MKLSLIAFLFVSSSTFAFGHNENDEKNTRNPAQNEEADVGILFSIENEHPESRVLSPQDSCVGWNACGDAGYEGNFNVGSGSCDGDRACNYAAYYGNFNAGDSSCVGDRSCRFAAFERGARVNVGNGSCLGKFSCYMAGLDAKATIGVGSCVGEEACKQVDDGAIEFSVGNNSCTCDGCCKELLSGSKIGDCQCISLDEGCSGTRVTPRSGTCDSDSPSLAPTGTAPSDSPSVSSSPSALPSSDPSNLPSSLPSMAPSIPRFQDLTFDKPSNILGLTQSEETVDLSHLVKSDDEPQHLGFSQGTNVLSLSGSNVTVDLSNLDRGELLIDERTKILRLNNSDQYVDLSFLQAEPQELNFLEGDNRLSLSGSTSIVDLSSLDQALLWNEESKTLGLTNSNVSVDLSSLELEPQDLSFSKESRLLSLSGSDSTVDLSALDKGDLTWNEDAKMLGMTNSHVGIDLSFLEPEPKILDDGKTLEVSKGGKTLDLSPLRVITLQATVDEIDGKDTSSRSKRHLEERGHLKAATSARRLSKKDNKKPVVGYGGTKGTHGWTIFNSGRLLGMTIAANAVLEPGSGILEITLVDCTSSDDRYYPLGQVLTLGPGEGRANKIHFASPVPIQSGSVLCVHASRIGKIDSQDKDNAANVLIFLEQ